MQGKDIKAAIKSPVYSLRILLNKAGIRNKKVFVVGFNKCASTSLHALFVSLGRPSFHGDKWRSHDDPMLLRKFDCFSDGTPRDLAELDRAFPASKFILNVRDLRSWIYSRLAHIERGKKSDPNYKTHPGWEVSEKAVRQWIRDRNDHHLFVLSYFSGRPSDLLVVNFIRDELAAEKVSRFLGYRRESQRPLKNVNPSKEHPKEYMEMLQHCITELGIAERDLDYDIYCPSIESEDARSQFPPDSSML